MSLKKYEAFSKTVELGSLTKAAEALGYTQSSMSHMLNGLESELGLNLLLRSRGGIKLTTAGEQILAKIREILDKKRELDTLAETLAGENAGVVRVGAFTSVAVNWLPGIIKEFQKSHPAVEIKMYNGDYHDIQLWLAKGEVDVGFLALPGPEGVRCIPLKEDPLVAVLPVGHPLAEYESVPIALAAREPMISLLETSSQDVYRALGKTGVKPEIKYETKDDYAIIAMVRAGLGISIMPQLLLRRNASDVVIRPLEPFSSRILALGYSDLRPQSPAAESFCDCVAQWVQSN